MRLPRGPCSRTVSPSRTAGATAAGRADLSSGPPSPSHAARVRWVSLAEELASRCSDLGGGHLGRCHRLSQIPTTRGQRLAVENSGVVETLIVERPLTRPGSLNGRHLGVIRTPGGTIQRPEEATQELFRFDPDLGLDPDFEEVAGLPRQANHAEVTGQIRNQGGRRGDRRGLPSHRERTSSEVPDVARESGAAITTARVPPAGP